MSEDVEVRIITPPVADRTDPIDRGLIALVEAIDQKFPGLVNYGFLSGRYGYGVEFENEVFTMLPDYQDAECDCGFNEVADAWHEAHQHSEKCYSNELARRVKKWEDDSGFTKAEQDAACDVFIINGERFHGTFDEAMNKHWQDAGSFESHRSARAEKAFELSHKLYKKRRGAERKITKLLCVQRGIPWNNGRGSAVHCDCGVDEAAKDFFASRGHAATCAIELPNFRHKASGFEIRWYKWIGRDMETNGIAVDFQAMFAECLASIK